MALRLNPSVKDHTPYQLAMLDSVREQADDFDVLHFHIDLLHFPVIRDIASRTVTTLHGRLDLPDLKPFYAAFPEIPLVSVSRDQRRPLARPINWVGNVYHGLPRDLLRFTANPKGDYVAFLGRIAPEKRPDRAIEIAACAGMELKIAAKIDRVDRQYWEETIAPMIAAHPNVEYIGEINEIRKADFLGNARALLFPIDWPEPFGLVMIEAMACGTPVVAFRRGSVPEVINHGKSGFIVRTIEEAVDALGKVEMLDRHKVRKDFEKRFTVERMVQDYLAVYRGLPGVRTEAARIRRLHGDEVGLQAVA
jgi:glycosyltransferase involved in cell wall biosynthesis